MFEGQIVPVVTNSTLRGAHREPCTRLELTPTRWVASFDELLRDAVRNVPSPWPSLTLSSEDVLLGLIICECEARL